MTDRVIHVLDTRTASLAPQRPHTLVAATGHIEDTRGRPLRVRSGASISTSLCTSLRSSGSPPVSRTFSTPWAMNTRVRRVISSKVSRSECGRKW